MPKLYFGSRGGVYYKRKGRKVYVTNRFGQDSDSDDDIPLDPLTMDEIIEDHDDIMRYYEHNMTTIINSDYGYDDVMYKEIFELCSSTFEDLRNNYNRYLSLTDRSVEDDNKLQEIYNAIQSFENEAWSFWDKHKDRITKVFLHDNVFFESIAHILNSEELTTEKKKERIQKEIAKRYLPKNKYKPISNT